MVLDLGGISGDDGSGKLALNQHRVVPMQSTNRCVSFTAQAIPTLIVCLLLSGSTSAAPLRITAGDYAAVFDSKGAFALDYRGTTVADRDDLQLVNTKNGWKSLFSYGASKSARRSVERNVVTSTESIPGQIAYTRTVAVQEDGVTCRLEYRVDAKTAANRNYYFLNIPQELLAGSYFECRCAAEVVRGELTGEESLSTLVGPEQITFVGPRHRVQFELAAEGATWLLTDWTHTEHKSYRLRVENELSGKPLDVKLSVRIRVQPSSPAAITQARQAAEDAMRQRQAKRFIDRGMRQREPLAIGSVRANGDSIAQYAKCELTFDLAGTFDNPFDPDQIDVSAEFVSASGKRVCVPAFFYQDCALNEKSVKRMEQPVWKVRFTPTEPGRYSYRVTARNQGRSVSSPSGSFQCTPASSRGFVHSGSKNPLYLEFEDGSPYVPRGVNLFYSTRLGESITAERLAYCKQTMNRLADQQGNFIRLRMDSWWLAIEMTPDEQAGYLGLGYYHQPTCWEIDRLYDLAAERGLYVMHCLDNANGNVNLPPTAEAANANSWRHVYNVYVKANGGVIDRPDQFWNDPEARRSVRNRLRYCAARWGYSRQLMSWEFWNEVSCRKETIEAVTNWHRDMARYLRTLDPHARPITTSLMGDHQLADRIWELPEMVIMQFHYYARSEITPAIAELTRDVIDKHHKPFLLGEYGLAPQFRPGNCEFDSGGVHMHNGMWASLFSGGCGTGAMWYIANYVDVFDLYPQYHAVGACADLMPCGDHRLRPCRVDSPALAGPAKELHWRDLLIPAGAKYGLEKPPSNDVTIHTDGQIEGAESVRSSLHCSSSRKAPPQFHVQLEKPAEFVITVSASVGNETNRLLVHVDGQQVVEEPFPAGKQFNAKSTEIPQYKNWRTPYDKEVRISLAAGKHTIRPEAQGKDRLEVQYALRGAIAFEKAHPVRVLGFATPSAAYLWLQNRSSTWWTAWEDKQPIALPEMTTNVHDLADGVYQVRWFDTWSGEIHTAADAVSKDGLLRLTIPPLVRDVACLIEAR